MNSYRLVINDSARSNHIELVTQQWRKLEPPIPSTSHCEFNGIRLCTHARKTIPLAPIHPFTTQIRSTFIVSAIFDLSFLAIIHTTFPHAP